jgi:hypothetical protein
MKKLSFSLLFISIACLVFGQTPKADKPAKGIDPLLNANVGKLVPVAASIQTGTYFIKSQLENREISVGNNTNANFSNLVIWNHTGGENQQFTIEPSNEAGYYFIKTIWGRSLDIQGASTASGATLYTYDHHGGDNQKWKFIDVGNGYYNIQSKLGTYLDVQWGSSTNGSLIWMSAYSTWNNNIAQRWKLEAKPSLVVNPNWGPILLAFNMATVYPNAYFGGTANNITSMGRQTVTELGGSVGSIKVAWGYKAIVTYEVSQKGGLGGLIIESPYKQMEIVGDRETLPKISIKGIERNAVTSIEIVRYTPLNGWVDMHTHPMSHLGWGKKLFHGAPDIGSIIPKGTRYVGFDWSNPGRPGCFVDDIRAPSMEEALSVCSATHQEWAPDNNCGNVQRRLTLGIFEASNQAQSAHGNVRGAPTFVNWPKWNDITHQQMWVDWIQRSQQNGLRVMVALAVNNKTLADAVKGDAPTDDTGSAILQIQEIISFVNRHNNFMEVAYSSTDLRRIVSSGRLAVVVGVEIDNIGNFNNVPNLSNQMIVNEIDRLYRMGVRYVFPIHVLDNKFGGTAVYKNAFNYSNKRETGQYYQMECGQFGDNINYYFSDETATQLGGVLLGQDPFRRADTPPSCSGLGHVNQKTLTEQGEFAIKEFMRRAILIDIDHMSQKSANRTIQIAEGAINNGSPLSYPLNSGHNGLREGGGSENSRTLQQVSKISSLGGLFGVGSDGIEATDFLKNFDGVWRAMGYRATAMGTDVNGFAKLPKPRVGSNVIYNSNFPKCVTGSKDWDYNTDGVAHYGLLPDFIRDIRTIVTDRVGGGTIDGNNAMNDLFKSAEYFAQMWEKCERQRASVR